MNTVAVICAVVGIAFVTFFALMIGNLSEVTAGRALKRHERIMGIWSTIGWAIGAALCVLSAW